MKWETKILNDVVLFNPKLEIKKGEYYDCVEMEDINPSFKYVYPNKRKIYKGSGSKFSNGDTLFARITPCLENGKIAEAKGIFEKIGIGSTEFFVIREKESFTNKKFVYYLFLTNYIRETAIKSMIGTSGRQRAQLTTLQELKVKLPPINTQRKIASILTAYDDLIENNLRRIKLLEEAARLIYKEWFVNFRFPGYESIKFVNGLPEGWERKKLGDVFKFKKGKNITQSITQEGDIPVVAGGLVPTYYHNKSNVKSPVITISASGANAGFVAIYLVDIWASDCSYLNFESTDNIFYLYNLLKFNQQEIFSFQKGAAQPHVYPADIERLNFIQPLDNFLELYDKYVNPIFILIRNLQKQNRQLKQARDILLPRLMNGEIEV